MGLLSLLRCKWMDTKRMEGLKVPGTRLIQVQINKWIDLKEKQIYSIDMYTDNYPPAFPMTVFVC